MILLALIAAPSLALGLPQHVGRVVVTPVAVEEDSRCPMNARCIQAGRVVVRTTVRDGRHRTTHRFTLGEATAGLVLDSVTPERMAGTPQRTMRYRVHFAPAP